MTTVKRTPDFDKDADKLRKYNIEDDISVFSKAIIVQIHQIRARYELNRYLYQLEKIPGHPNKEFIYKATKFRCRYLRNSRDIRVIFTYDPTADEVILIEIYPKNNNSRQNHNDDTIAKYAIDLA